MLAAGVRILGSFSTLGHSLLVTLSVNLGQFKQGLVHVDVSRLVTWRL